MCYLFVNRLRKAVEPGHKLLVTLRYMSTGELYRTSLRWNHRLAHNTISFILRDTCKAIYEEYQEEIWTYFFVGDEAFPLKSWLMKKFPSR